MRHVVLAEYERREFNLELGEARAIASLREAQLSVGPSQSGWTITAGSRVGAATVGDTRVIVRPKIPMHNALMVLGAAPDRVRWLDETVDFSATGDLVVGMVMAFRRGLDRALGRGLRRDYRVEEDLLQSIRGRIDLAAVVRRPGLPLPIPCRFDEYTPDNRMNRLLLGAIERSLRVPGVPTEDRLHLMRHLALFAGVGPHDPRDRWVDRWKPNRLEQPYESAVRPADLILKTSSIADGIGTVSAAGFFVDMNVAIERFIADRLRLSLQGRLDVITQAHRHLDEDHRVTMRPDLEFRVGRRTEFVADIKYKDVDAAEGSSTSDLYQLHAYATIHGLRDAALITCPSAPGATTEPITVARSGIRLHILPVDLTGRTAEVIESVDDVACRIAALARLGDVRAASA